MKTKILVIFISFIFLFTYNVSCFAVTDVVNEKIDNKTENKETEDIIEINETYENIEIEEDNTEETIEVKERFEEKIINNVENNIRVANYSGMINIDSPQNNQTFNTRKNGMEINICGWAVSNAQNSKIQCFIDDNFVNSNIERVERNDVNEIISPAYGGVSINPKAGFNCIVNLSLVKTGIHSFKIKQLSQDNQVICESTIDLNIENQPYIRKNIY